MSQLTYGDVILPYVMTNDFRQSAVFDDMGGTDWIYTRFDITCTALISNDYMSLLSDGLTLSNPESAAEAMKVVRHKLLQPRKTLSFVFNGVELMPTSQDGLPGTIDARNGPQPQHCSIIQLTDRMFIISWSCVAHYWEANTIEEGANPMVTNNQGNNVLFNRWSETADIDNLNFTKLTREGKFVIRSDNRQGFIADQLRTQFAVVGCPEGFLREAAQYTQTPDGLAIQYRVVDQEVFKMPPRPAFHATGTIENSWNRAGAIRYGAVSLTLRGDKNTSQQQLVNTAFFVAVSKLSLNGRTSVLESASCRADMYENSVTVSASVMFAPGNGQFARLRQFGVAGLRTSDRDAFCFTPGSDMLNLKPPDYPSYGTAGRLLQAAAYYDPSLRNLQIDPINRQLTGDRPEVGELGRNIEGDD